MSDKTEMVSVPRELLERAVKAGGAGVNAIDLVDAWRAIGDIRTLLAAPAEDVRAVGDEPVAIVDESDDGLFVELIYGEDGNPLRRGDKLYRHAQREMASQCSEVSPQCSEHLRTQAQRETVMPGRMTWDGLRATACNIRGEGWNACLDEFKRLNP